MITQLLLGIIEIAACIGMAVCVGGLVLMLVLWLEDEIINRRHKNEDHD